MSIRDLRDRARAQLHKVMQLDAIYIAPGGTQTVCTVRIHHRKKPFGDMAGFDYAPAERLEEVPEVISLIAEITPERGGVFSIASNEAYQVENPLLPDGITISSQVTVLDPEDTVGLPVPS